MVLSWNEIKQRAIAFSHDWADATNEKADSQTFWNEFFEMFGITRRRIAQFECRVKTEGEDSGYIDLLWKGQLLIEHKSRGKKLEAAYAQALKYFPGLKDEELPKFILVSDFANFELRDLDENKIYKFKLAELHKHVQLFGFIAGYKKKTYQSGDPVNIAAAELMGELHDQLLKIGYRGHHLEVYLVRLLFCLFADDAGIFEKNIFADLILQRTNEDGSDIGARLAHLFQILDTAHEQRPTNLDEFLNLFPYVNGQLFSEVLPVASFDSEMRKKLLKCCKFIWSNISPAIFGSLFQSVMDPEKRRNIGAHYTSEQSIMKLIKPLFLDELYAEFETIKRNKSKLIDFHTKLASLKFFDPACGCGNFLIIVYRELRLLEIKIL
ncbi:MAG TPA: type IIL restriction-modification enzyme MmeI, partial [Ignavibacteriales bacterium]|nr:type IIL restriction-modification enzyme MmeI [Ignavibacteriales bacterium]